MLHEQDEELSVLESIYGDDCEVNRDARTVQVWVPSKGASPCLVLRALLVAGYPAKEPPAIEIDAPHWSDDAVAKACAELESQFVPGEVVLYQWVEQLKDTHDAHTATDEDATRQIDAGCPNDGAEPHDTATEQSGSGGGEGEDRDWEEECEWIGELGEESTGKQVQDSTPAAVSDAALCAAVRPLIVSGQPFTERKSTFQAHVARISSPEEARAVVQVLLESNKIRNATHNMMAYRIECVGRGTFNQDFDDDGEAAAGSRLMHLLQVADARNVVVVVSRWFGGVLLGPSRFTLINNTARALLEEQGFISAPTRRANASASSTSKDKERKRK